MRRKIIMNKINGLSLDLQKNNIDKIKELFPEAVEEGKINFDMLRAMLGDEVDESREKYQFTWNGKAKAIKLAQTPSSATLRPCKNEKNSKGEPKSKNWDTTENIYIEGDNLEVLKQLQKTYYGKIKMIYIDPPYNTGNDFVYHDDFRNNINNYKEQTNQMSSSNPESSGRFHTDWLNMMYPRLILSKNLLSNNGVICIQIDDHEYSNLKKLCDEVFGEINYMTTIVVKMSEPTGVKMTHANSRLPKLKEYVLVYKKSPDVTVNVTKIPKDNWDNEYKYVVNNITKAELVRLKQIRDDENRTSEDIELADNILKKMTISNIGEEYAKYGIKSDEGKIRYNFENAYRIIRTVSMGGSGKKISDKKRIENQNRFFSIETLQRKMYFIKADYDDNMPQPRIKILFADDYLTVNPCDLWIDIKTTGLDSEGGVVFKKGKKPLKLLERLIETFSNENDVVMDFFSGSASTAHAVMDLNRINGSNRKFILVQLPQKIDIKADEYESGFENLCDLGEERIRLAGEQIKTQWEKEHPSDGLFGSDEQFTTDIGFKVFKLDSTNVNEWDPNMKLDEKELAMRLGEVFKEDRSKEDILYEIMLKYGVFDKQVEEIDVNGKTMYRVGKRYMIVCLEDHITSEDVKAIGKLSPRTAIFNEVGFMNDNDKINAVYNLEKAGVEDVKCI